MKFELTERIFVIAPEHLQSTFAEALTRFGEDLPDGNRIVRTIGAHWDNVEKTAIRAADFPETITGTTLPDGRIAFSALWQVNLCEAFEAGEFPHVEQIEEIPPTIEP